MGDPARNHYHHFEIFSENGKRVHISVENGKIRPALIFSFKPAIRTFLPNSLGTFRIFQNFNLQNYYEFQISIRNNFCEFSELDKIQQIFNEAKEGYVVPEDYV